MGVDFEAGIKLLVPLVTTDCNLRCRYCYANGGDAPVYMDWRVATAAFIDYISKNGGRMVNALAN